MFSWFNKFKKHTAKPIIPGSKWFLDRGEGPWPKKRALIVAVIDCKDGWVLYDMGGVFNDERMKEYMFIRCYKPLEE